MRRKVIRDFLCAGVLLAAAGPNGAALTFRVIENDGFSRRVLLVYDCGALKEDSGCLPFQKSFSGASPEYSGDHRTFVRYLSGPRFEEVWLLSGGGDLRHGILIGNELRERAIPTRVPSASRLYQAGLTLQRPYHCVSACTVAFMGGLFRTIDDSATYQVHAASSVSWNNVDDSKDAIEFYRDLIKQGGLREAANFKAGDASATIEHVRSTFGSRTTARDLFKLFQDTLLVVFPQQSTLRERQRRTAILDEWVREGLGRKYPYDPKTLAADTELYALEGDAALQDILMRIERDAMGRAISDIRGMLPQLGRRADAALALVAAMYDTSGIKETNRIPKETLLKMGYVTADMK